jgi:hypothetical protein
MNTVRSIAVNVRVQNLETILIVAPNGRGVDVQYGRFLPGTAVVDTAWRTLDAVEESP